MMVNDDKEDDGMEENTEQMVAYKVPVAVLIDALLAIKEVGAEFIDLSITMGENGDAIDIYVQEEYLTGNLNIDDETGLESLA